MGALGAVPGGKQESQLWLEANLRSALVVAGAGLAKSTQHRRASPDGWKRGGLDFIFFLKFIYVFESEREREHM